jgi:hypothetical protein
MDRFKVMPDGVKLVNEVVNRDYAPGEVERIDTLSMQGCKKLIIVIRVGKVNCVRVRAIKNNLSEWRVSSIDASLPKLLWGHNGRCIKTEEDYLMALTVLRRLMNPYVTPATHERILPGVGPGNRGSLGRVEITVQMHDPGSRILRASHSAKYPKVRKPNGIFHGESTKTSAGEHGFSIYDKRAEMGFRKGKSKGIPDSTTRIERIYRSSRRLAQAIEENTDYSVFAATLSFPDAYSLLRREVGNLTGFHINGAFPPSGKFNKHASLMAALWDGLSPQRRTLDHLMSTYKATIPCCSKTMATVRRDLGALLATKSNLTLDQLIPPDPAHFPWEDIPKDFEEEMHRSSLHEKLGEQITTPDPAIVEAFSKTRILRKISGENCRLGPTDGSFHYARPWDKDIR